MNVLTARLQKADAKDETPTQAIDRLLAAQWKAKGLKPAGRTTDTEFVRRAYLDLHGRIPTSRQVLDFEADKAADKRAKLIDKLLRAPEFEENWANLWTNWLLPRSESPLHRAQLHLWLSETTEVRDNYKAMVTQLLTATGKNNDNCAVNYLLGNVGKTLPQERLADDGQFDMVPATLRSVRLFLGYRLNGLDNPHHRPPECDWTPADFWGVNAFFRQVERIRTLPAPGKKGLVVLTLTDNGAFNRKGLIKFDNGKGGLTEARPKFLGGQELAEDKMRTRREVLAELIVKHENFSKAFVNRVWGYLFGRGLHERPAVDDFNSRNKIVHPELLDRLAKDFAASGHSSLQLIRWICNSDAYQLQSTVNASNEKPEAEVYFSRMPLKLMTPEQLIESLVQALDARDRVAAQLKQELSRIANARVGDLEWQDQAFQDRVILAVALINRKGVGDLLTSGFGPVATTLKSEKDEKKVLEKLYLRALGRRPTDKEAERIQQEVEKAGNGDAATAWQDVFWALLNSSEFILNH